MHFFRVKFITEGAHFAEPEPPDTQARPTIWGAWSPPKFTSDGQLMRPARQLVPSRRFSAGTVGSPSWCKVSRFTLGLTQVEMARALGICYKTWCNYEQGLFSPKADTCEAVLHLLAAVQS